MRIIPHIRRVTEIASNEGIIEAGITIQREITGSLRYWRLKFINPNGYYLRYVQGSKMYLKIDDPGVSRDLIIRGMREREETRMIQKTLRPGMTVIDIGANIGYYTLMEARAVTKTGRVYAIEPEPHNFELLHRNVKLNNYQHVDMFQIGISDETGLAKLYVSEYSNLHNLLCPLFAKNEDSAIDIKVYRLDDFVLEHRIIPSNIDLIRMDIEGYEVKALEGMDEILREAERLNLFIEFHPMYIENISDYSLESTMAKLDSLGYKIRYATVTAKNGYSIKFRNITTKDLLRDKQVSRDNIFMIFLSNY